MKIADIEFGKYPIFLAPMEDVTDEAFRLLCKRFGADMVYTEFVSSDALIRDVNSTLRKLNIYEQERPVAIQIYGNEVEPMVEAMAYSVLSCSYVAMRCSSARFRPVRTTQVW